MCGGHRFAGSLAGRRRACQVQPLTPPRPAARPVSGISSRSNAGLAISGRTRSLAHALTCVGDGASATTSPVSIPTVPDRLMPGSGEGSSARGIQDVHVGTGGPEVWERPVRPLEQPCSHSQGGGQGPDTRGVGSAVVIRRGLWPSVGG